MARKIAVDILKKQKAKEVFVKIAYAIGIANPVMVSIEQRYHDEQVIISHDAPAYDLTPNGIIKTLDLRKPQYEKTARWGHFGNGFAWDK